MLETNDCIFIEFAEALELDDGIYYAAKIKKKSLEPVNLIAGNLSPFALTGFKETKDAVVVKVTDELLEVLVNPNTPEEFYAELYLDSQEVWKRVRVIRGDSGGMSVRWTEEKGITYDFITPQELAPPIDFITPPN